jgi:hypothetical protein
MIAFRRVFCDGTNMERINFRDGIVGNVKNTLIELKNFISEKTFLQVSKMLTLIISYSKIVYLVSNFPSFLDLLCYRGNSVFFTGGAIDRGSTVYILISSTMISTLFRGKNTHID